MESNFIARWKRGGEVVQEGEIKILPDNKIAIRVKNEGDGNLVSFDGYAEGCNMLEYITFESSP